MAFCNVDPHETYYVGDMQSDMFCANRAGVDFIHAKYGYGEVEWKCLRVDKESNLVVGLIPARYHSTRFEGKPKRNTRTPNDSPSIQSGNSIKTTR